MKRNGYSVSLCQALSFTLLLLANANKTQAQSSAHSDRQQKYGHQGPPAVPHGWEQKRLLQSESDTTFLNAPTYGSSQAPGLSMRSAGGGILSAEEEPLPDTSTTPDVPPADAGTGTSPDSPVESVQPGVPTVPEAPTAPAAAPSDSSPPEPPALDPGLSPGQPEQPSEPADVSPAPPETTTPSSEGSGDVPTEEATEASTDAPTDTPIETEIATEVPTDAPSDAPTDEPTDTPTNSPTETPTETPTGMPTLEPRPTIPEEPPSPSPAPIAPPPYLLPPQPSPPAGPPLPPLDPPVALLIQMRFSVSGQILDDYNGPPAGTAAPSTGPVSLAGALAGLGTPTPTPSASAGGPRPAASRRLLRGGQHAVASGAAGVGAHLQRSQALRRALLQAGSNAGSLTAFAYSAACQVTLFLQANAGRQGVTCAGTPDIRAEVVSAQLQDSASLPSGSQADSFPALPAAVQIALRLIMPASTAPLLVPVISDVVNKPAAIFPAYITSNLGITQVAAIVGTGNMSPPQAALQTPITMQSQTQQQAPVTPTAPSPAAESKVPPYVAIVVPSVVGGLAVLAAVTFSTMYYRKQKAAHAAAEALAMKEAGRARKSRQGVGASAKHAANRSVTISVLDPEVAMASNILYAKPAGGGRASTSYAEAQARAQGGRDQGVDLGRVSGQPCSQKAGSTGYLPGLPAHLAAAERTAGASRRASDHDGGGAGARSAGGRHGAHGSPSNAPPRAGAGAVRAGRGPRGWSTVQRQEEEEEEEEESVASGGSEEEDMYRRRSAPCRNMAAPHSAVSHRPMQSGRAVVTATAVSGDTGTTSGRGAGISASGGRGVSGHGNVGQSAMASRRQAQAEPEPEPSKAFFSIPFGKKK